jgi:class 3 adenylate cyclase/tetratricopeptide (TPR) repeat protein
MERKLAAVLFVDLVESSALLAASDPEVVRRRITGFFADVSDCIEHHGGKVEKFAGDAVMAAFGIPQAHEDDAERALRAALAVLDRVRELGLEARIGVEAGEVVADDGDSTFATGEAVSLAARLQQVAAPNEILLGPGAYRLAFRRFELEGAGTRDLRGFGDGLPVWRALREIDDVSPFDGLEVQFVGREAELDLLDNTFARAVRTRRAHLVTIFGEPGVGKSRLAHEFLAGAEGALALSGRALPYGEGITYWPLAEMVKAAAGISDDDPPDEAHEKLLVCCEDEAVADLIGLASGVLEAVEGERSQQEIAWAAREWAEMLAAAMPLVLVFEDIHWAEEPLLDLIEHLADWVRDAPLLILCLARPELLDERPGWGGGRLRGAALELDPLPPDETEELVDLLLQQSELGLECRTDILTTAEGNPLFVEETVRMLAEGGDGRSGIPDTLQALIAARIDRLPAAEKALLQRAAVIGRTFWEGALDALSPGVGQSAALLDELLRRELVQREPRSTITGERAYRFKHVLIREVGYAGLPKADRADYHRRFADWLHERLGEELLEIRAYHLDQTATLVAELDGAPPAELAQEAAAALERAGKRALAREANTAARRLLLRAVELEPTLRRRHHAAVAAWRLGDYPALANEADEVLGEARSARDRHIEGRALNALADVALTRDADIDRGRELVEQALAVLPEDDVPGRFDALMVRGWIGWITGNLGDSKSAAKEALALAGTAGRKDLESQAAQQLAEIHIARLEAGDAEPIVDRAAALAEESGSLEARGRAFASRGKLLTLKGELDEAERALADAQALFEEAGVPMVLARTLNARAWLDWRRGRLDEADKRFRESIRILKPLEDRGTLCESQRSLAQLLLQRGKVEEAERVALEARKTVGPQDVSSRATTRMALALVRAAQGRDDEAEKLLREALEIAAESGFNYVRYEVLRALAAFLRERGRDVEADALEAETQPWRGVVWGQPELAAAGEVR